VKLHIHEDGSVSPRITPIENGYLVKPGGGQAPAFFPTLEEVAEAVADAIEEALEIKARRE
jgi:hypothetical protein